MMKHRTLFLAAGLAMLLGAAPVSAQETDGEAQTAFTVDEELAEQGEDLFESKQCFTCHTIGDGVIIGPDLEGVVARRDPDWLRRMIRQPVEMTETDSLARRLKAESSGIQMPNPSLSDEELEALIHYIASESSDG